MNHALFEMASQFQIVTLQISLQLKAATTLPFFKGSMWHGWFGYVLMAADQKLFHLLCDNHEEQQPKPYVICPSDDHKTQWQAGEVISFDLTLIGAVSQSADTIMQAIFDSTRFGHIGIGHKCTPYCVLSVASHTPTGLRVGVHHFRLTDWLDALPTTNAVEQEMALHFLTPVRVKYQGKVVKRNAPDLRFWHNQALRRFTQLSRFWVLDNEALINAIYREAETMGVTTESQSHCFYEDWQRYSQRQQENLPFGGLKGQVSFYGEVSPLLPIFKFTERLHLGGKTTFGLGKYQLLV